MNNPTGYCKYCAMTVSISGTLTLSIKASLFNLLVMIIHGLTFMGSMIQQHLSMLMTAVIQELKAMTL